MTAINDLLELLKLYGGRIVSTASQKPEEINEARDGGRLYVDDNGFGFVWHFDRFPETEEEVTLFEKWYPYPVPKAEVISPDKILARIKENHNRKYN